MCEGLIQSAEKAIWIFDFGIRCQNFEMNWNTFQVNRRTQSKPFCSILIVVMNNCFILIGFQPVERARTQFTHVMELENCI